MTVSALAEQEKKVPPRTPLQRLDTLQRFANLWIETWININQNRPGRATRMTDRVNLMTSKLEEKYAHCGFFDPNVPNGGPRPVRKRRSDDLDIFDNFEEDGNHVRGESSVRLSQNTDIAWKQI